MKKFPYLPDLRRGHLYKLSAGNIMTTEVCYLTLNSTFEHVMQLLEQTSLKSYPLVESSSNMVLLGTVKRGLLEGIVDKELESVASKVTHISKDAEGQFVNSGERPAVEETNEGISDNLRSRSGSLERRESALGTRRSTTFRGRSLSELRQKVIEKVKDDYLAGIQSSSSRFDGARKLSGASMNEGNFGPGLTIEWREVSRILDKTANLSVLKLDPAPFQLVQETPLAKVHSLFTLLGLTHSFVTSTGRLVGVVRLKDLQKAIEASHRQSEVIGTSQRGYFKLKRSSDPQNDDDMYESQSFLQRRSSSTSLGGIPEGEGIELSEVTM